MARIASLEGDKKRREVEAGEARRELVEKRRKIQASLEGKIRDVKGKLDLVATRVAKIPGDAEATKELLAQLAKGFEEEFRQLKEDFSAKEQDLKVSFIFVALRPIL